MANPQPLVKNGGGPTHTACNPRQNFFRADMQHLNCPPNLTLPVPIWYCPDPGSTQSQPFWCGWVGESDQTKNQTLRKHNNAPNHLCTPPTREQPNNIRTQSHHNLPRSEDHRCSHAMRTTHNPITSSIHMHQNINPDPNITAMAMHNRNDTQQHAHPHVFTPYLSHGDQIQPRIDCQTHLSHIALNDTKNAPSVIHLRETDANDQSHRRNTSSPHRRMLSEVSKPSQSKPSPRWPFATHILPTPHLTK